THCACAVLECQVLEVGAQREEWEDVDVEDVDVHYAMSGDARLAYTVRGRGPHEIVFVPAWLSNQDVAPTPAYGALWEHVSTFATVVMYGPGRSGLSGPVPLDDLPTLERWAEDLHTIVEAVGFTQAVLIPESAGGPVAMLYAATHPERTR